MNQREKILAAIVVVILAGWGGKILVDKYYKVLDANSRDLADAQERLDAASKRLADGRYAARKLQEWQTRALPADREKALTLYKAWLLEKAQASGIDVTDINPAARSSISDAYSAIGYQIKGSGSLTDIATMLYEFYKSPKLHQVVKLDLSRAPGTSKIEVTLDVEALSMAEAVATETLPEGDSKRLRLASLDEYKKTLSERDLVSVYTPPRPPRPPVAERRDPPAPPKFDDAEQAHFTGSTTGTNGSPEAWINIRTTGETQHLAAGDAIKIGALEGKVVSIDPRSLVYESEGKKFRVALGESLRKGKELAADDSTAAEKNEKSPES